MSPAAPGEGTSSSDPTTSNQPPRVRNMACPPRESTAQAPDSIAAPTVTQTGGAIFAVSRGRVSFLLHCIAGRGSETPPQCNATQCNETMQCNETVKPIARPIIARFCSFLDPQRALFGCLIRSFGVQMTTFVTQL